MKLTLTSRLKQISLVWETTLVNNSRIKDKHMADGGVFVSVSILNHFKLRLVLIKIKSQEHPQ